MKTAFAPVVDERSRILILGTMPGEASLKVQQYYGHTGNHFWRIIFALFGESFSSDYEKKKALLLNKRIALWDVLSHCEGAGSADKNIINEVANDFEAFYKKYPLIKTVFFASTDAEKFYNKYIGKKEGRAYYRLPSPSGANAWKTLEQKIEEWKRILEFL